MTINRHLIEKLLYTEDFFRPMLLLPFYTCKEFHPVFKFLQIMNSPKTQLCCKGNNMKQWNSLADNKEKKLGENKLGANISLYTYSLKFDNT